jgi:thiol:disulfide interchange protein DsbD
VTRVLALAFVLVGSVPAGAQATRPKATVEPLVAGPAHPGSAVHLAVKVTVPEGLHTQSNRPRDPSLIPSTLILEAPPNTTVDEIVWPPAIDLKQIVGDKPLAVFEREFVVGASVTLAKSIAVGDLAIHGRLRYQACDVNLCYPPATANVEWTVQVIPATSPIKSDPAQAKTFASIAFGTGEKPSAEPPKSPAPTPVVADSSAAADASLLDDFVVAGKTGGYQDTADFLQFIHNAEAGVEPRGMFEGRGPLAILLLVLIGGLALNLTPCVLPMIPINLAIIGAGAQAQSRSRGFLLGSAYGGAMAFVYGVLGIVVILTAGTFGTINSSPWFNLAIAALFVILGLAMFDLLIIDFSKYSTRFGSSGARGSVMLAFSMGAIAALLAGACVAPVVIQVVLFASNLYSKGTRIALALPFFLGIGMAIPWPIAGAGISALPKPGQWMVRVKQAFGVFILITAAYYGYEGYSILANRWVDPTAVASSVEEQLKSGWHSSLAEGLAVAKREKKPVLIDAWATWCKNCLTMDKTTLASDNVKQALSGYVKIKFRAEDPDESPAKEILQRMSATGLPAYAILKPRN